MVEGHRRLSDLPLQFQDTDDGVGDPSGIIEKVGSLADRRIGVAYLNPVYASPAADNGYDIADYRRSARRSVDSTVERIGGELIQSPRYVVQERDSRSSLPSVPPVGGGTWTKPITVHAISSASGSRFIDLPPDTYNS